MSVRENVNKREKEREIGRGTCSKCSVVRRWEVRMVVQRWFVGPLHTHTEAGSLCALI